ncbi:acyl carrier protein [Massilia sp. GCM10020059]|uniref:Acyl carrier protein n=1 Tax=Massilia agrisoli TaxID=2892444 RepID=A0ABS8IP66_9BURK|nr:acyl carrier protein [Massilia agrisoli]MCC6069968.1 acyl carrier protein [Massilia agrisoli]
MIAQRHGLRAIQSLERTRKNKRKNPLPRRQRLQFSKAILVLRVHLSLLPTADSVLILMKLTAIFSEIFQVPESTLQDQTQFKEIPTWDSLQHMLLITRVEDDFQVQFDGDQIADMRTLGDVRKAVLASGGKL